jgi:hypothetical protein
MEGVEQFGLSPDTLVKSWFVRRDGTEVLWGQVVAQVAAEPLPGHYLCQLLHSDGGEWEQRIFKLDEMAWSEVDWPEWRFFDQKAHAQTFAEQLRAVLGG